MRTNDEWIQPALAISLLALISALLVRAATGYAGHPSGVTSLTVAVAIVAISAVGRLLWAVAKMWRANLANPIDQLRRDAPSAMREQGRILAAVLLVGVLLYATSFLKSMITAVIPFWADTPFALLDKAIGLDGQTLAKAMGSALPWVGYWYGLWHVANLGGILWIIHWRIEARGRFILSYMLTWAIGMAAAYAFSSAGPLFTGRYDLASAPESVRIPAEFLWANYQAKGALLGGGISAFPSLHVGIATWFALALGYRGWRIVGAAYVASIYFGSVVLGWHYGADGAGGILIAWAADRLAQQLTSRRRQLATA